MSTYRVWYTDGSAVLIDAESAQEAMATADAMAEIGQYVRKAEELR